MKTPALLLIAVLTITSTVLAVDPPPDGGYPNQNTAEGEALCSYCYQFSVGR
jgi:hypothetical protein